MDFNSILNQVLNGGQQIAQQRKSGGTLGNILGNINNDTLKGFGGGVAATGLLSLLMGKKGFGSNALQMGSMAALGALAYNAWKNYQGGQAAPASAAQGQFIPAEERSQAQTAQASELICMNSPRRCILTTHWWKNWNIRPVFEAKKPLPACRASSTMRRHTARSSAG